MHKFLISRQLVPHTGCSNKKCLSPIFHPPFCITRSQLLNNCKDDWKSMSEMLKSLILGIHILQCMTLVGILLTSDVFILLHPPPPPASFLLLFLLLPLLLLLLLLIFFAHWYFIHRGLEISKV